MESLCLKLLELVGELFSVLAFELLVRNLFETETVIPFVEQGFNKVLLEGLRAVLLPEVLHSLKRAFRQDTLALNTFVCIDADLLEFRCPQKPIELHSFDDSNLFALSNIKLHRMLRIVCAELIFSTWLQKAHCDRILDPLLIVELSGIEKVKVQLGL